MHVKDPRAPPLRRENKSSYRTYMAVERGRKGAQYVQRLKGMVEKVLQQEGMVVLKRDMRQGQPLIWTPSASARG